MDSHYSYGPVYAPTQPPEHRHTSTPTSLGYSSGPNPSAYASTLPPISHSYSLPYPGDQSVQGNQTSQPSYTANAVSSSNSVPYSAYASQYSSQYNTTNTYSQTPRSFPLSQGYHQVGSNGTASPAYSSAGAYPGRLPDIRPMPTERSLVSSLPKLSSQRSSTQRPAPEDIEPTHVVGSQGRRGILPSATGRPVAVADPNESKGPNAGLKKDPSDGKWPCEHCNKRYLHAKHLKRHLLRHTGTRPYSCGLCRETFSRSDILKRHFMKCSIRRGNPTGANHLTHSRATRKLKLEQSQEEPLNSATSSAFTTSSSHSADFSFTGLSTLSTLSDPDLRNSSYNRQPASNQISRASSVKRTTQGTVSSNKGNHSAPNSASLDGSGFYSGGQATPDSLTTSGAATPFNYPNDPRSNQLSPHTTIHSSMNGLSLDLNSISRSLANPSYSSGPLPHIVEASHDRSGEFDWSTLQHLDGNEEYTTSQYHSNAGGHHQHIKPEPGNYHSGAFNLPQRYASYQTAKQ